VHDRQSEREPGPPHTGTSPIPRVILSLEFAISVQPLSSPSPRRLHHHPWFVLFATQAWLIEAHRVRRHQQLGIFGALLAVTVLIVGAAVVTINAREGRVPENARIPVILILSYINLLVFGLFVGTAIGLRRRSEFHKRLMLLATLNLLSPAVNRIPLDFIQGGGLLTVLGIPDLFILICVVYDTVRHRRLHPAFGWGTLLSLMWPAVGIVLGGSSGGSTFARWVLNKTH
jgi:hypothetical protein